MVYYSRVYRLRFLKGIISGRAIDGAIDINDSRQGSVVKKDYGKYKHKEKPTELSFCEKNYIGIAELRRWWTASRWKLSSQMFLKEIKVEGNNSPRFPTTETVCL